MNRWNIALLSACVLGILALLFWELEYQHLSLLLWLLVAIALLWACAWVTVSLRVTPYTRQRHTATPTRRSPLSRSGMIALGVALVLMVIGIIDMGLHPNLPLPTPLPSPPQTSPTTL